MKVLVFGASGKVGTAIVWDLAKDKDVEAVGIVGRRKGALESTKDWVKSDKVRVHALDVANREEAIGLMKQYDVGVISLPDRRTSYRVADAAIEAGLHIVDILEEYHRKPDMYETEGLEVRSGMSVVEYGEWLHRKALENDVTFMSGIGFAPGLSNITLGEAIRKMDKTEKATARVGGIPTKKASKTHPLRYMITWAFSHVLREYMVNLDVIRDGKVVEVKAMSDYERFRFDKFGQDEELECFVTPGMPSFLSTRPNLQEFSEKTVRWPGHWQAIQTLKECGLLDLSPVESKGIKVVPRELLLSLIEPKLRPCEGETDVCVMYNTATGMKDGKKTRIEYFMWDEADKKNGISSMARVTGFSASVGAIMIGRGEITEKGVVAPEDCIDGKGYQIFMEEIKKRNIEILEIITPI